MKRHQHDESAWVLRGGLNPDTANVTNVLTHVSTDAAATLSESMVLGIGGGLGAGYLLWEVNGQLPSLILGFRFRWNMHDWAEQTLGRLGARYQVRTTTSQARAAAMLTDSIEAGRAPIIRPDRQLLSYWHLHPDTDTTLAPPVYAGARRGALVAYGLAGDGILVDDRNLSPLTVDAALLAQARAKLSSSKNYMLVVDAFDTPTDLSQMIRAGIADCVEHLHASSTAVALPAWEKWAGLLTDRRNAKGWPKVYAEGRGLTSALLAIWMGVNPAGRIGGDLRACYADFLDEAAAHLGSAEAAATATADLYRIAALRWQELAEAALPSDVPEFARLRRLVTSMSDGVVAGDQGVDARGAAATELWTMLAEYDADPPVIVDLATLADRLGAVAMAERSAAGSLRQLV
ncbi:BtrH N-terminal domain-containing protein [Salinispora arenicola]|uniref:BtrH N-terminal domain-containing protein n=1 Tax=Salinispora arenicola TaxID=168697 RepID=UPI0002FC1050|nr:BtrH N-terminal domain-containing protein [Salinispora arenicola]NIL55720.1 BtrH N-terminal domain-containing protein [Salinispora arenicola]NIL61163.1 BtrH N-terminal domain-containing protein [Salinispora arenicola]